MNDLYHIKLEILFFQQFLWHFYAIDGLKLFIRTEQDLQNQLFEQGKERYSRDLGFDQNTVRETGKQ